MNKFNKKGFTLIEMLVVIAIIAVLVSIVVPVVSNSTTKAAAAANAANLRTVAAQVGIWKLEDPSLTTVDTTTVAGKASATVNGSTRTCDAPVAKGITVTGCTVADEATMSVTITSDNIVVKYGTVDIATLAKVAETGSAS